VASISYSHIHNTVKLILHTWSGNRAWIRGAGSSVGKRGVVKSKKMIFDKKSLKVTFENEFIVKKLQFKTVCKDNVGYITQLSQQK